MKAMDKITTLSLDLIECMQAMHAGKGKWTVNMDDGSTWVVSLVHKAAPKKRGKKA